MSAFLLAHGDPEHLQNRLWERDQIEVPIHFLDGHYLIRVSCHLYNTPTHIDHLVRALRRELGSA